MNIFKKLYNTKFPEQINTKSFYALDVFLLTNILSSTSYRAFHEMMLEKVILYIHAGLILLRHALIIAKTL